MIEELKEWLRNEIDTDISQPVLNVRAIKLGLEIVLRKIEELENTINAIHPDPYQGHCPLAWKWPLHEI